MLLAAVDLAGPATDMTVVSMFMRAGLFEKVVMLILGAASVWSWAVIIDKQLQFQGLAARARKFEKDFWDSGRGPDELAQVFANNPDPMSRVFIAAYREFHSGRGAQGSGLLTVNQRIDRVMSLVILREVTKAERGLGVLASVSSSAPFIGLLGTVWGIMTAFRDIAAEQSSNIAVVAPGIAGALFATALGLIAAVPASIFYNKFASDTARFSAQLEGFSEELSAIFSRRLQERPQ